MIRTILIVDDDKIWLRLIQKKFEKYRETFSVIVAGNGVEAVEKLKRHAVSLVVTDMQMPRMDGLALLAHLSEHYPDVQVIVVTAYSTPKLKRAVLERGGAGYIEKPFVVEDLARKITDILKKESEGGILQTVPLEMFIQLIEMEQKTCTIRVFNKLTGKKGVLFFNEGELLDARVPGLQGERAAYDIFSWDEVTLSIQDTCAMSEKKINKDLQAILLDVMRLKDEAADSEGLLDSGMADGETKSGGDILEESFDLTRPNDRKKSWEQALKAEKGIRGIYRDNAWDSLIEESECIGKLLGTGRLKACFISRGDLKDIIIVPGKETMIISVDPNCSRDRILSVLKD